MAQDVRLGAVVMFVRDLDRSVAFYRELLGLDVVDRSTTAALLTNPGGAELILRAMGDSAQRALGSIGAQYVIWTVSSRDDLDRCERLLRERSAHPQLRTENGAMSVEGTDPDDTPVVIVYHGPNQPPLRELPTRIYAW
ncbi:MAG TPA: VOC family protein [Streptosporangiaceae bacterium]|jgi:catechol-2,3-dioxygenase|nr:VOC family protein [Streptosporangiaceae bacterium]